MSDRNACQDTVTDRLRKENHPNKGGESAIPLQGHPDPQRARGRTAEGRWGSGDGFDGRFFHGFAGFLNVFGDALQLLFHDLGHGVTGFVEEGNGFTDVFEAMLTDLLDAFGFVGHEFLVAFGGTEGFEAFDAGVHEDVGEVEVFLEQAVGELDLEVTEGTEGFEAVFGHFLVGIEEGVLHG